MSNKVSDENNFAFILGRIEELKSASKKSIRAMEIWLAQNYCKHCKLETDSYEFYCLEPRSKPNKVKMPYDFEPRKHCIKCKYYEIKK